MNNWDNFGRKLWKICCPALILSFLISPAAFALEEKTLSSTDKSTSAAISDTASKSDDGLANQAGDDFKGGAKSLGSGFKNGARYTGKAFKKAGTTMGRAFKKAGKSIKEFFVGKKDGGVEEQDIAPANPDFSEGAQSPQYNQRLDQVGS